MTTQLQDTIAAAFATEMTAKHRTAAPRPARPRRAELDLPNGTDTRLDIFSPRGRVREQTRESRGMPHVFLKRRVGRGFWAAKRCFRGISRSKMLGKDASSTTIGRRRPRLPPLVADFRR
jgi:hypothetical protein